MSHSEISPRPARVLSGMRPTGNLHIGNYHGALKNWVDLQHRFECFFFVADWHALTTAYDETQTVERFTHDMVVDWLGAGLEPEACTIFVQSKVPEHAELHLYLSMITPLSWVERVPTYKAMIESLEAKDLATYGFLGYPVMQAADILIYRAEQVPVGVDQAPHVEMSREIARRFNDTFGRGSVFESRVNEISKQLGKRQKHEIDELQRAYRESGDTEALAKATDYIREHGSLAQVDKEVLEGYIRGGGRVILPEPKTLLTSTPSVVGVDGRKMSKSYRNVVMLREESSSIESKIARMQTDPARVRLSDPGDPAKCPVYTLHEIYLDDAQRDWAADGCKTASIGCRDCKQPLIDAISSEQADFRERAQPYVDRPERVTEILNEGSRKARKVAGETMSEVRAAIGIHSG